ncbi:hypothetical protein [Pseudomonas protegens]|uniref:hypothetical protein n=1 Tax=Pseudomonas protegens TaxID=380021 RepID=UPI00069FF5E5|nr:hypothetical protein [Pseudomonas protegens]
MPTETQHLEQRVAALQSDLNTKDEQIDALTFSDNDRELSRRDWFEAAQVAEKRIEELRADLASANADKEAYAQNAINLRERLERLKDQRNDYAKQLAERDALLERCRLAVVNGEDFDLPASLLDEIKALSASAEPINDLCAESAHEFVPLRSDCVKCGALFSAEPSAPVERAEFEQAFVVQEGVYFSADRNEYRSMNGRPVERTDATDLNLRLQGWQARAALERKPCH